MSIGAEVGAAVSDEVVGMTVDSVAVGLSVVVCTEGGGLSVGVVGLEVGSGLEGCKGGAVVGPSVVWGCAVSPLVAWRVGDGVTITVGMPLVVRAVGAWVPVVGTSVGSGLIVGPLSVPWTVGDGVTTVGLTLELPIVV